MVRGFDYRVLAVGRIEITVAVGASLHIVVTDCAVHGRSPGLAVFSWSR